MKRLMQLSVPLCLLLLLTAGTSFCEAGYAKYTEGTGNMICGEELPYGNEAAYKNVIGESIKFSELSRFQTIYFRAYLTKRLEEVDHNVRVFVFAMRGVGGDPFEYNFFYQILTEDSDPKMAKRDQCAVMFENFQQNEVTLRQFFQDNFNPSRPYTVKLDGASFREEMTNFGPDLLLEWKKDYNLKALDVHMLFYTFTTKEILDIMDTSQGDELYHRQVYENKNFMAAGKFQIIFD